MEATASVQVQSVKVLVFASDKLRLLFTVSNNIMERAPTKTDLFQMALSKKTSHYYSFESHQTPLTKTVILPHSTQELLAASISLFVCVIEWLWWFKGSVWIQTNMFKKPEYPSSLSCSVKLCLIFFNMIQYDLACLHWEDFGALLQEKFDLFMY